MSPQVLVVSRDAMLLQTRQLILGAFFRTLCAGRMREVEVLMSANAFDLIILCYTLSEEECQLVMGIALEQKPRPQVLRLTPAGSSSLESLPVDSMLAEAGPYYLLKRSAELLGVEIQAKPHLMHA
jgi:DNA-binding response OmpR family regulator